MQTNCEIPDYFSRITESTKFEARDDGMIWLPKIGLGFHANFDPDRYDNAYFDKYALMDSTSMGHAISDRRYEFVRRHTDAPVVDFGIGAGGFLLRCWRTEGARGGSDGAASGYDINENAAAWLRSRGAWLDPWLQKVPVVTFWDSLEHVPDIEPLLANVTDWAFISMPIVCEDGYPPSPSWRHYRPGEHLLYATRVGLVYLMATFGFRLVDHQLFETELGRMDIGTFAFQRVTPVSSRSVQRKDEPT